MRRFIRNSASVLFLFLTEQKRNDSVLGIEKREAFMVWLRDMAAGVGLMVFLASSYILVNAASGMVIG